VRRSAAAADLIDAVAGARIAASDGTLLEVYAARRQRDGRIEIAVGARRIELPDAAGAQLALADLDANGRLELVTSENTSDPGLDAIRVRTLNDDGSLSDAFRVPVPSGVRALATCPSEGDGLAPIVAATGDGLWVLR
jgi:hypothetical protein